MTRWGQVLKRIEIILHICICTEFAFIKFKLRYIPEDNKDGIFYPKEYYSELKPSKVENEELADINRPWFGFGLAQFGLDMAQNYIFCAKLNCKKLNKKKPFP